MRIFTNFIPSSQTLVVDKDSLSEVVNKVCDLLEISPDMDEKALSPSDERALGSAIDFVKSQSDPLGTPNSNALVVCNLNSGKSLLLLSMFSYFG